MRNICSPDDIIRSSDWPDVTAGLANQCLLSPVRGLELILYSSIQKNDLKMLKMGEKTPSFKHRIRKKENNYDPAFNVSFKYESRGYMITFQLFNL